MEIAHHINQALKLIILKRDRLCEKKEIIIVDNLQEG